MDKRKILIIGHTYVSPVNRLKFDFMAKDERFELLLVTPRKWKNYVTITNNTQEGESKAYKTEFVDVKFGGHPVKYIIPKLGRIIRKFKPELIYCEQEPICLVSLQVAILTKNTPVIYFSFENTFRKDTPYRFLLGVRWISLKKSFFMVAGSKEVAKILRCQGYHKPVYCTPHLGVSEGLFHPQINGSLRKETASDHFFIGFVGRFIEQKDIITLIKASKLLRQKFDCHLVLLGNGPLKEKIRAFALKSGMEKAVIFCNAVSHDKVPQFIHSLDVLVLPSRTTALRKEQFGHVLIEAMACGVPVIGSSSGEIPNVIGDAGLVFREGDAEDLACKIAELYGDHELKNRLVELGLTRVRERFTDERIAANMIALFEIALGMERITKNTLEADFIGKIKLT